MTWSFAVLLILILSACRPVSEKTDDVGVARHLLNKGEYEQAIGLLSESGQRADTPAEQRVLLASAYAGSVGVNLVDSYSAFSELLFKDALVNSKLALDEQSALEISDRLVAEREILSFVTSLGESAKVIFGFKWIPPEKRTRVFLAAMQIDAIPKESDAFVAARVYKVIILSALVMSTFRDSLGSPEKVFSSPLETFCELNGSRFGETVGRLQAQMTLLNGATEEIVASGKPVSKSLSKLYKMVERLRGFFEKNRSVAVRSYFANGALRNELCKL